MNQISLPVTLDGVFLACNTKATWISEEEYALHSISYWCDPNILNYCLGQSSHYLNARTWRVLSLNVCWFFFYSQKTLMSKGCSPTPTDIFLVKIENNNSNVVSLNIILQILFSKKNTMVCLSPFPLHSCSSPLYLLFNKIYFTK